MEKMNDLRDLLKHEIQDLYSVEEQIIAAMPAMIEKASNPELIRSLKEHLRITEQQKARLDQVQQAFGENKNQEEEKGLLSRLFKTKMVCKGMQGIIAEGNQIMNTNMDSDVMDAAIIACAQKIEHYEICGYGTAKAYARELNLTEVERLLEQTLNEEYQADDRLTALAVGRLNKEAESASEGGSKSASGRSERSMGAAGSGNTRSTQQRVPQEEMEMEMASNKSGSASRGTTASKGTSAPKGSAGGRTASGSNTTPAASKTAGSRSSSATTGISKSTGKSAGSTGKSATTSSSSRGSSSGRTGNSSRTR